LLPLNGLLCIIPFYQRRMSLVYFFPTTILHYAARISWHPEILLPAGVYETDRNVAVSSI
ncbi:hypothetical protein, partial [Thermoclostridium caenicola]|uniref:hypothetical protein n=1 Tax=Thermoclostridium caenicola TaxID=659425 RepID=UPI001A9AFEA3